MAQPRSIEQMVEAQIRRWEAAQQDLPKPEARRVPPIAISREHGALGGAVARRVAERLGFELWDKNLLKTLSEETGASERMIDSLDEHTRNGLEDLVAGIVYGVEATGGEYVRQLARVVYAIAHHGKAVFLGRGAYFILRPATVLRVRIVCPLEKRVVHVMERRNVGRSVAEKEIEHTDKERAIFNKRAWDRNIADISAYDLVVNTEYLTVDSAADLVGAAYRAKFPA